MFKALAYRFRGSRVPFLAGESAYSLTNRFLLDRKPRHQTLTCVATRHYSTQTDTALLLKEFDIDRHRKKLETFTTDTAAPNVHFSDMPFIFDEKDNHRIKPVPCYISEEEISANVYPNLLRDMKTMLMRQYLPHDTDGDYATVFFFQGTGYIAREIAFTDAICRYLCHDSQSQVIIIPYPLAPENKWPMAKDGANQVLDYIYTNRQDFKVNLNDVNFVSYSSGTAIAIHAAYYWLSHGRNITKQYLVCPFVDFSRIQKGFEHYENQDAVISENFVKITIELSVPAGKNRKDPDLSPFYADPSILPLSYIVTGENDRTRGDAERYTEKLIRKGVKVEKHVISGQDHALGWRNMTIWKNIAKDIKQNSSDDVHNTVEIANHR